MKGGAGRRENWFLHHQRLSEPHPNTRVCIHMEVSHWHRRGRGAPVESCAWSGRAHPFLASLHSKSSNQHF